MTSGRDVAANLSAARTSPSSGPGTQSGSQPPSIAFLRSEARERGIWLVGGTVAIRDDSDRGQDGRVRSASLLLDPCWEIKARYDKIHLFDVGIPVPRIAAPPPTLGIRMCLKQGSNPLERIGLIRAVTSRQGSISLPPGFLARVLASPPFSLLFCILWAYQFRPASNAPPRLAFLSTPIIALWFWFRVEPTAKIPV